MASVMSEEIKEPQDIIQVYIHLTKEVLPSLAKKRSVDWPVYEDHCFQRIVLDIICGGVWYEHLKRPAYKNLTNEQAKLAVELCEDIINGKTNLNRLNQQSLSWRRKLKAVN